ncbi:MAG: diacylglycerol kinase [Mariprofundaceae bacterium]
MRHLLRLVDASWYAWQGLRAAMARELAFQTEVVLLPLVAALAFWLGENGVERALLLGSWLLVMIVELLNSAIEAAIDRIGAQRHELSALAKDLAAAGVLVSLGLAACTWALILWPRL